MKNFGRYGISYNDYGNLRPNMKWADELMDIFRKYHPRREISELEGDINSIMKKLILKTHPDKGGDEYDFNCVFRTRELIKDI